MMEMLRILFEHLSAEQKYFAAAFFCGALLFGFLLVQLCFFAYEKVSGKQGNGWLKAILTILLACGFSVSGFFGWLNRTVKADESAREALLSTDAVMVHPTEYGYFFDGWGTYAALIFYGEETIEEEAYAPLLSQCAAQGIDCFMVRMPYHRAYLNVSAADEILQRYDYGSWYMAAHGSGAQSAAAYANAHSSQLAGMILFGAYPEVKLNDGLRLIAVYAQRDGLFDYDGYDQAKSSFPEKTREAMITGANHSGFGAYEKPGMDHEALISSSLQQRLAAQMVRMALMGAD